MTNDKALEAAARALFLVDYPKDDWGRFGADDYHPNKYRAKASAAISAYLSALPGEAEVVGYLNWSEIHQRRYFDDSPRGQRDAWPLVTLDALQAMQARAEKADRERDAFRDMADGYGKLDAELAIAERRAEAAEARVKELEEALELALEYPASQSTIWGDKARTALKGGSNG